LLRLLKEHCPAAEYEEYGKAIARAIHGVQRELISRVVAEHPELKQEMEAKVAEIWAGVLGVRWTGASVAWSEACGTPLPDLPLKGGGAIGVVRGRQAK
jgi:hypothetical protein